MAQILWLRSVLSAKDAARGSVLVTSNVRKDDGDGRGVYGDHTVTTVKADAVPASWGPLMTADYRMRCTCGKRCPSVYAEAHLRGIIDIGKCFKVMEGTRWAGYRAIGKRERKDVITKGLDATESSSRALPKRISTGGRSEAESIILRAIHDMVLDDESAAAVTAKIEELKAAEVAADAPRPQPAPVVADDDDDPVVISAAQASAAAKVLAAYSTQKKAAAADAS